MSFKSAQNLNFFTGLIKHWDEVTCMSILAMPEKLPGVGGRLSLKDFGSISQLKLNISL